MRFEWNPAKARGNFRKHGISFEEACSVFYDPLAPTRTIPQARTALSPSVYHFEDGFWSWRISSMGM